MTSPWSWDSYLGTMPAKTSQELEAVIGFTALRQAQAWKLVGSVGKGSRRVAVPLVDESGAVRSAVLVDPTGRAEPSSMRVADADTGHKDNVPLWASSVPGTHEYTAIAAAIESAAGKDLNVTSGALHVLAFVGDAKRGPAIGITGRASFERLAQILEALPTWRRPARLLHWFADDVFPEILEAVRQLGMLTERMLTPEERDQEATNRAISQGEMYVLYSGRVAVWSGAQNGQGGRWREAAKGSAQNILVERGWTAKSAMKALGRLPSAVDFYFDPRTTARAIDVSGERYLNEFYGMTARPETGPWGTIYRLLLHLVDYDTEGVEYFLDWLAAPLQSLYSGKGSMRTLSAVVLHGVQGTGKGWLTEILRVLYGDYMLVIGQNNLEDAFDPAKMTKLLFLVANEVTSVSNRDEATMNRLKAWVTEEHIPIRRMHAAGDEARVHFNMLFTSNADRPVRLEASDRRYSVWVQDRKLPPDLIDALKREKETDNWRQARAFLAALLSRAITRQFWKPYENTARTGLMESSLDSTVVFARQLRDVGFPTVARDWCLDYKAKLRRADGEQYVPDPKPWTESPRGLFVHLGVLSEVYRMWCRTHGYMVVKGSGVLKKAIVDTIPDTCERHGRITEWGLNRGIDGLPKDEHDKRSLALLEPSAAAKPTSMASEPAPVAAKDDFEWFPVDPMIGPAKGLA